MPAINAADLAASYGWSMAILNSDPELKKLFNTAVSETWTADKFVAKVRDTKWFKTKTEAQRTNAILQKTDPAEYNRRWQQVVNNVRAASGAVGAVLHEGQIGQLAHRAMDMSMSVEEIQRSAANMVNWAKAVAGNTTGRAGQIEADARKTAAAFGIKLSNNQLGSYIDHVLADQWTPEKYMEDIKTAAKNTYRGYADQIEAGKSVEEIMEPFRQSMANILEIDPTKLDAFDPTIRKAMTYMDPASKKPTALPIWQFEEGLRKDPRWMKTDNGKKAFGSLTRGLLQSWGLAS